MNEPSEGNKEAAVEAAAKWAEAAVSTRAAADAARAAADAARVAAWAVSDAAKLAAARVAAITQIFNS